MTLGCRLANSILTSAEPARVESTHQSANEYPCGLLCWALSPVRLMHERALARDQILRIQSLQLLDYESPIFSDESAVKIDFAAAVVGPLDAD